MKEWIEYCGNPHFDRGMNDSLMTYARDLLMFLPLNNKSKAVNSQYA